MDQTVEQETYRLSFSKGLEGAQSAEHSTLDGETSVDMEFKHVFTCERLWPLKV